MRYKVRKRNSGCLVCGEGLLRKGFFGAHIVDVLNVINANMLVHTQRATSLIPETLYENLYVVVARQSAPFTQSNLVSSRIPLLYRHVKGRGG